MARRRHAASSIGKRVDTRRLGAALVAVTGVGVGMAAQAPHAFASGRHKFCSEYLAYDSHGSCLRNDYAVVLKVSAKNASGGAACANWYIPGNPLPPSTVCASGGATAMTGGPQYPYPHYQVWNGGDRYGAPQLIEGWVSGTP